MTETNEVRCAQCGTWNRIRGAARRGRMAVCGRCKAPLSLDTHPLTATDQNFDEVIKASPVPVLLDLWAPWCGPCRMVAPILDQLAAEYIGQVRVAKLNVDENPMTAARFSARSIPTLLILFAGQEIDRIVGVQPKSALSQRLDRVLQASRVPAS